LRDDDVTSGAVCFWSLCERLPESCV
jgi:hypothetical protein